MEVFKTKYLGENWTGFQGTKYLMDNPDAKENEDYLTDNIWDATLYDSVYSLHKAVPDGLRDTTKVKPITITYKW